jgi:hypothetical protein
MIQLQPAAAANSRVRMVGSGPLRPMLNGGQQFGTARPGGPAAADRPSQQGASAGSIARPNIERREPSIQERERALHATPIPPSPRQDAFRNDRPAANPVGTEYRMQNTEESRRQAQEVRPAPDARPMEQPRAVEQARQFQARPIEQPSQYQARPIEQPRAVQQPPQFQARPTEQPRAVQQPPQFQARPIEQPRAVQQPPQFQARPIEQPRPIQRPVEQARQEARPIEAPRAAPPAAAPRQAPPPQQQQQQRSEERRGRPDPRVNRQ